MKVKICGLTNLNDAKLASGYGADFLGFIFYSGSKRAVSAETAAEILSKLKGNFLSVGVFVNEALETILEIASLTGIRTVQLHGNERPETVEELKKRNFTIFKSLQVKDEASFKEMGKYQPDRFLLDTWHPSLKGGTGETFDWALLKNKKNLASQVIVAGGINENNIERLLTGLAPWGIDVSSGVEASPGKKDPNKLEHLFKFLERYKTYA